MKNYILVIIILNLLILPAYSTSNKVKVAVLEEFSTENPADKINLILKKDFTIENYELKDGDILKCNVSKVVPPKHFKRNAKFYVKPYAYISNEDEIDIETNLQGKYSRGIVSKEDLKEIDKGKAAKQAAMKASETYIKTMVPGYSVVKGMILNEEGNIVKSGIKSAYKDSPLAFCERGKNIYLEPDDTFYLTFKKVKHSKKSEITLKEETEEAENSIENKTEEN